MAQPTKTATAKAKYVYAIGRRKTATARVRLFLKAGDWLVNDQAIAQYFPGEVARHYYSQPLKLLGKSETFSFTSRIVGSGKTAQLQAMVHGLSRALIKVDPAFKSPLKQAGFITRDSRMKQSRQIGTGGKARRKKQSPKR